MELKFLDLASGLAAYLPRFRPRGRTAVVLAKSLVARAARGSWIHAPARFEVRFAGRTHDIRTSSLANAIGIVRSIEEGHDTPSVKLGPRPTILDCGANIGLTALHFKALYPDAQVHAFEPQTGNFSLLEMNLSKTAGVRLHKAAVGERDGTATLFLSKSHSGAHSLALKASKKAAIEKVGITTLERFLEQSGIEKVYLLKLDVEGSELEALEGLGSRIRDVGVILGEIHTKAVSERKILGMLEENGFRIVRRNREMKNNVTFEAVNVQLHPTEA